MLRRIFPNNTKVILDPDEFCNMKWILLYDFSNSNSATVFYSWIVGAIELIAMEKI